MLLLLFFFFPSSSASLDCTTNWLKAAFSEEASAARQQSECPGPVSATAVLNRAYMSLLHWDPDNEQYPEVRKWTISLRSSLCTLISVYNREKKNNNLLSRVHTNCSAAFCPHADRADGPRTAGRSGPAAADVGSGGVGAAAHQRSVRRRRLLAAGVCR